MRISDWISDVCSSDLAVRVGNGGQHTATCRLGLFRAREQADVETGLGGAGNEVAAVGRVAHRGGRDALQILYPHVAREQRIAAQREQAARGVLFGDAPVDRQAAAEPGGYLCVEESRSEEHT